MIYKMKCFIKNLIPTPQFGHPNNLTLTFVFLWLRFSLRKCREKLSPRPASQQHENKGVLKVFSAVLMS